MRFINSLKTSAKIKRLLFILCCAFFALYVFSIPACSGRSGYVHFISYAIMILLLASSLTYVFLFDRVVIKKRYFILLIFVLHSLVGTIIYSHQFSEWKTLPLLFITFLVFILTFSSIDNMKLVITIIVVSLLLFALYFFVHYRNEIIHYLSLPKEEARLGKYFDNVNQIGSYMSVGIILSFYSIFFFEKKIKYCFAAPVICFLAVGFFTGSRTFVVSFIVALFVFLIIKFKSKKWIIVISFAVSIVIFILFINLPFMSFLKNQVDKLLFSFLNIGAEQYDTSVLQRSIWQVYGAYLGFNRIVFGYGHRGFEIASFTGSYSHSNFAELLCNFGIVGFMLFNITFVLNIILGTKNKSSFRYLVYVFAAYYFINGFMSIYYFQKDTYIVFALLTFINKDIDFVFLSQKQRCIPIDNEYYRIRV